MATDITKVGIAPAFVHFDATDLGCTSAPVEFGIEGIYKEITCDQTGAEILAKINQGSNVTVKTTFKETDLPFLKKMYEAAGLATAVTGVCSILSHSNQVDCEAATGIWTDKTDEVLGFGTATVGTNLAASGKVLQVIPTDSTKEGKQLYFWKVYPIPGGLNYSGEEDQDIEVEFSIVNDSTKPASISKGFLGKPTNYIV